MRSCPARLKALLVCGIVVSGLAAGAGPARAASGDLDAYRVQLTKASVQTLVRFGYDVTEGRRNGKIEFAATALQVGKLKKAGLAPEVIRDSQGRTTSERSRDNNRAAALRTLAPAAACCHVRRASRLRHN